MLADLRLGAVLLAILAIATGAATLIENHYAGLGSSQTGRAAAYDLVYDAPWFNILLAVLFLNILWNLIVRLRRGRPGVGFVLVHSGVLIILIGAGLTRWFGFEGYLHIREGQSNDTLYSTDLYVQVWTDEESQRYPVRLYRPGLQSISRRVELDGRPLTLGVREYWPRFERVMRPGEGGIARVALRVMENGDLRQHILEEGDVHELAGVPVRFHRGRLPPIEEESAGHGVLRVRAGGEVCRFPVASEPGPLGSCGGWSFELSEYQPEYLPPAHTAAPGPMLRVTVRSPGGETAVRTLMTDHPEPALAGEPNDLLGQVDMLYERRPGIELGKRDGQVWIRATFPIETAEMDPGGRSTVLPAGEAAPLVQRKIYRAEGGLVLVPAGIDTSLVPEPAHSRYPSAPAAARLFIERDGQQAQAICMLDGAPGRVELDGRTYRLAYGRIERTLPYSLYLEEFRLETYPGSDNPASYESHVRLYDSERGIEGRPVRIWMNNPLNHRGAKHFQSSYDRDRRGTVLSVNRDPGKNTTYAGYTVITLGFLLVLIRAARRIGRRGRIMAVLAGLVVWQPIAAEARTEHEHGPPPTLSLSSETQALASRLIVQDSRGRMKPLDTLARETTLKITRTRVFEDHDPVELFLAFAVLPSHWYRHPAIAVTDPGIKDLLGIDHDRTHVSLASVLPSGQYLLRDDVEVAHRTEPGQRSRTQRQLIRFDERVHLMYNALSGGSLRIYPIPDDPGDTWGGIREVLDSLPEDDPRRAEYQEAADALFAGLETADQQRIVEGLRLTGALQQREGKSVKPSAFRIDAELQLNRLDPFRLAIQPYLAAFVVLIIAYFVHLFGRNEAPWELRRPLYAVGMLLMIGGFALHCYGFVLRWIASARAPLSNAHESLLWVPMVGALACLVFEFRNRTAVLGAFGSLLAAVVLAVSMMSAFDPAIGPLQPVLSSYWLIIHVTVITASYGFFGLCCLLGFLTLLLMIIAVLGQRRAGAAVDRLHRFNVLLMIHGLALLAVGTLLGGVWANESWGRYWGWDPKETWALVSILVYALILHLQWIPRLAGAFVHAACSFMAIWVIIMTYFGVNHLLSGLHSYAAGDASRVPGWVFVTFMLMAVFTLLGFMAWRGAKVRQKNA